MTLSLSQLDIGSDRRRGALTLLLVGVDLWPVHAIVRSMTDQNAA